MRQVEPVIKESGSVEDVHYLRLIALLHDLVRQGGGEQGSGVGVGHRPQDGGLVHEDGKAVLGGAGCVGARATVGGRLGGCPATGAQRCLGAARGGTGREDPKPSQGKRPPCLPQESATLLRIRYRLGHQVPEVRRVVPVG